MSETDRNVPYGIPLSNQRFYILDENDNPCADYVIGEICIAGKSLAKGYMNDPELTNNKFQYIGQINERIYRTGDLGLYREDGIIDEHLYPLARNEGGDYFYWDIRDENVYMIYCDDVEIQFGYVILLKHFLT